MRRARAVVWAGGFVVASVLVGALAQGAEPVAPPWVDPGDVPLPEGARSVVPLRPDTTIVMAPGHPEARRGTTGPATHLPLYGAKRAPGCAGRWLLVGPLAWVCGDVVEVSREAPSAPAPRRTEDGLPYRYFFTRQDGAESYLNLPTDGESFGHGIEAPEETLDPGFAVAIGEERDANGGRWGRSGHGKWIPMSELAPFHASVFGGVPVSDGALDFGWVASDTALVYAAPVPRGKPAARRVRFDRVAWREERVAPGGGGAMIRISADGAAPEEWIRARDLTHPALSPPPDEAGSAPDARWIDVDLGAQVLVAYEGTKPVFATLVSTGRGANATPAGVHRIWVKIEASDMENLADETDADEHDRFSIEDVPYVQYFDHGVALHGAFWHRDFGRTHSHGCVNLAPKDAAWLFGFTAPHLPPGWDAALPTELEPGTVVRVRAAAGDPTKTPNTQAFPVDKAQGTAIHERTPRPGAKAGGAAPP